MHSAKLRVDHCTELAYRSLCNINADLGKLANIAVPQKKTINFDL